MSQRIVVINDSQDILDAFRALLEPEGYEVFLFSMAPESPEVVERLQPDLLILDLLFGSENMGWQLLQRMRMHRSTAQIPVVVCTAAVTYARELEPQLITHNALLVLKPFDIDELLAAVRTALNFPRTNAEAAEMHGMQVTHNADIGGQQGGRKRRRK